MKKILRTFIIYFISFYVAHQLVPSVIFKGDIFKTIALVALALMIFNSLIRPIVNIFFLPINLLTLGLSRWLINILAFYALTWIVPEFKIASFYFPGANIKGVIFPAMNIGQFGAIVVTAFAVSLMISVISWIVE